MFHPKVPGIILAGKKYGIEIQFFSSSSSSPINENSTIVLMIIIIIINFRHLTFFFFIYSLSSSFRFVSFRFMNVCNEFFFVFDRIIMNENEVIVFCMTRHSIQFVDFSVLYDWEEKNESSLMKYLVIKKMFSILWSHTHISMHYELWITFSTFITILTFESIFFSWLSYEFFSLIGIFFQFCRFCFCNLIYLVAKRFRIDKLLYMCVV